MDYLKKLEEVIRCIKAHDIHLEPPVALDVVREIEKRYGISLPEEYVAFVTTVGNGGSLPDSTGYEQLECYLTPIENCSMDRLNKPFPYTDAWDWSHDDDYDCISDPEGKVEATQYGHFAFVEPNETGFTWDLIVDGPCKGEVWSFESGKMCRGKDVGFLDWVLDVVEKGFKDGYIDPSIYPRDGGIDGWLLRVSQKIEKKKFALRPPLPEEKILEIERTYEVKFPEDYVAFITKVGNGFGEVGIRLKNLLPIEESDLSKLSQPFPLNETITFTRGPQNRKDNIYDIDNDVDGLWNKVHNGYITISITERKLARENMILIINGPRRGEIWCILTRKIDDQETYRLRPGLSFMDWLEDYLYY